MKKVIVEIPEAMDRRKKSWRKIINDVDTSQSNGYAFIGSWVNPGKAEMEEGTLVLLYDNDGSQKNWYPVVRVSKATNKGLQEIYRWEGAVGDKTWALSVRDEIAELLEPQDSLENLKEKRQGLLDELARIEADIDRLEE